MHPAAVPVLMLLALALAGAAAAAVFAVLDYHRHLLLSAPAVRVRELRPGFAKVRGTVVPRGRLLCSPLSGARCAWFRFSVRQERRTAAPADSYVGSFVAFGLVGVLVRAAFQFGREDRSRWSWHTVLDDTRGLRAAVADGTGAAEVDFSRARARLSGVERGEANALNAPSSQLQDVLHKVYKFWTVDRDGRPKNLRFAEEVVREGDEVTVAGQVSLDPDGTPVFDGRLVVSDRGLKPVAREHLRRAMKLACVAGGLLALVLLLLLALVAFR
jgi:hypothetical protein